MVVIVVVGQPAAAAGHQGGRRERDGSRRCGGAGGHGIGGVGAARSRPVYVSDGGSSRRGGGSRVDRRCGRSVLSLVDPRPPGCGGCGNGSEVLIESEPVSIDW